MKTLIKRLVKPLVPPPIRKWLRHFPFQNTWLSRTILPGTKYSAFLLPIEYLPSRDFNPRWGHSRGPLPLLERWFQKHHQCYHDFLNFMRGRDLSTIGYSMETTGAARPAWLGGPISAFDALALYAIIQQHKPNLYLEIGSGMSTCFARQAITDAKLNTRVVSIDPEPRAAIDDICDQVVRQPLETSDLNIFQKLKKGDILFFDGSHRTFMNSDVTIFFLDILPYLNPGVLVHLHDIFLPFDYPDSFKYWYWNEQYLLATYLIAAMDRLDPVLPTAYICYSGNFESWATNPPIDLGQANDSWNGGGSFWFSHKYQVN